MRISTTDSGWPYFKNNIFSNPLGQNISLLRLLNPGRLTLMSLFKKTEIATQILVTNKITFKLKKNNAA